MTANRYMHTTVLSATLLFCIFWQTAVAGPPEKPGNPGVPGLLAEISELKDIVANQQDTIDQQLSLIKELEDMLDQLQNFVPIPQTGQTKCYNNVGNEIDCAGTGQDGDLQAGVEWPVPRFADNGDGTVTDNLTGLMWLRDTNCIATHYPDFDTDDVHGDGRVSYQHTLDFVAGINNEMYPNCGARYTDWRSPNIREFLSLIDYEVAPYVGLPVDNPFLNIDPNWPFWWSSTTALQGNRALIIDLGLRRSSTSQRISAISSAWPVRGGN